jgi:carbamoyl-phosphate synthase large subunit
MGATPVASPAHARGWIRYWEDMRGVPASAFTLSEYLPGRDFACQSLWKDGDLCLIKTVERLSYFGGASQPSGVSSIAALAKTVVEPRVVQVCTQAIRRLGAEVSGAFSVDLKANVDGVPCITEINAGRFITMMNLFDLTGKHNMSATYVRLALGETIDLRDEYDVAEGYYFMRDVDTTPGIFHGDELFEGIQDARD